MPTLDTYRKQAKLLMRWHRERDYSIGGRVRTLDRFKTLTGGDFVKVNSPRGGARGFVGEKAGQRGGGG